MTYIRLTGGRDRGYVKDFPTRVAQEMLALGQAAPVDFDEPDALGFRELEMPTTELSEVKSPLQTTPVESTVQSVPSPVAAAAGSPQPPLDLPAQSLPAQPQVHAHSGREGKKKR